MAQVRVTVDGVQYADDVEPRTLLVHYLRERLGKTGTLVGCDTSKEEIKAGERLDGDKL